MAELEEFVSYPEFSVCFSRLCLFVTIVIGTASDISLSKTLIIKNRVREYLKHMMLQIFFKEIAVDSLTTYEI